MKTIILSILRENTIINITTAKIYSNNYYYLNSDEEYYDENCVGLLLKII